MYTLTITYSTGLVDKLTPGTFGELSSAIDAAMAALGFTPVRGRPGG
jgi:hypothetical protein